MRKYITSFVVFLISFSSLGQYAITIDAKIIDEDSNEPIPYVNVGFVDKAIGTVSNEDGLVSIEFDEVLINENDIIQFSMIGYQTESYSFKKLIDKFQKSNTVALKKEVFGLEEIILESKWGDKVQLGSKRRTNSLLAYWKDKKALGGEIAGYIKIPKGTFKISELSFNLVENESDSVKVRVNVYDYKRGYPGDKFLTKPIYHTITAKSGVEKINISPANLIVNDDIIVSIELLEVYGKKLELSISQSLNNKRSYLRYISQDKWVRKTENGVDFRVTGRSRLESLKESSTKQVLDKVSIFWDASRSMQERDVEKELVLLKSYFSDISKTAVEVSLFSNTINEKKVFQFPAEENQLYDYLKSQQYYGNTDASSLQVAPLTADVTFIFSDGNFNLGEEKAPYATGDLFVINSKAAANNTLLNNWALDNGGRYLTLDGMKTREVKQQINEGNIELSATPQINETATKRATQGTVLLFDEPVAGVVVRIEGTLNEVTTDINGIFTIEANENDILNFEYLNTIAQNIKVTNQDSLIVNLEPTYDMLEEVKLRGKGANKKENITATEERQNEKNKSGGRYVVLEKEDFPPGASSLAQIMRRVLNIRVVGIPGRESYLGRTGAIGLFVVDGVYFSDPPNFLNAQLITSISAITSINSVSKYGTLGKNGVVLITTTASNIDKIEEEQSALVKGNDYKEDLQSLTNDLQVNNFEKSLSDLASGKDVLLKGRVLLNDKPASNCYVIEAGSLNETTTDINGNFTINTKIGATLRFEYKESKPKEVIVLDESFLNIRLESLYEVLDEVALAGKGKKEEIDLSDKEKRAIQKDRSGIGYQSVDKEDFNEGGYTFLVDLIRGRFLSIHVEGEGDRASYHTRNKSSIILDDVIVFAVDGVVSKTPPIFLNLNLIENITFKSTLAGTNKYGALGRNGVIEITTSRTKAQKEDDVKSALATDNDYKESTKAFTATLARNTYSPATLENMDVIRDQFLDQISEQPLEVNNYIAYYNVVAALDRNEAKRGLSTVIELANDNVRVLRSLAFFLEEQDMHKEASTIYERILLKSSKESQSFLDLAQSYKKSKQYSKSFEKLKTILIADSSKFPVSEELIRIAETETKHLLTKHKDQVNFTEVPRSFYETVHIIDRRILIEWNDPQMEFDLQFVNPAKKYYNWSQTFDASQESSDKPVRDGLLSKEFIIDDDSTPGEWIINITNNTFKESTIPSFIKMTVQSDYGGINEKEQILVIPISQLDQKYTVKKMTL